MKQMPLLVKLGPTVLFMILATGCFRYASESVKAEPQAAKVEANAPQLPQPTERSPGIIVHIDPQTGEITAPHAGAPGQAARAPGVITKTPAAELRQVPSPVPGGGVMIELDERFQTPLTATVGPNGKVKLEHKRATSEPDDKK